MDNTSQWTRGWFFGYITVFISFLCNSAFAIDHSERFQCIKDAKICLISRYIISAERLISVDSPFDFFKINVGTLYFDLYVGTYANAPICKECNYKRVRLDGVREIWTKRENGKISYQEIRVSAKLGKIKYQLHAWANIDNSVLDSGLDKTIRSLRFYKK